MQFPPILLAMVSLSFGADLKPFLFATGGLTMPITRIQGLSSDDKVTDNDGYSFTAGAGFLKPLTPQLSLTGSAGFTLIQGGMTINGTILSSPTFTMAYSDEFTVSPKLLDLDAGFLFRFTPQLGLGGGIDFSIPVGGTYEAKSTFTITCNGSPTACADQNQEQSGTTKGDIKEAEDTLDATVKSFANLRIQGQYAITDRMDITASYLIPMGDYISETGIKTSWSRFLLGVQYSFGS